jgi:UDP-N-acetylglucosamine 2-epimerase (non-hydrolysing)
LTRTPRAKDNAKIRPYVLETNVFVGSDPDKLLSELSRVFAGQAKKGTIPPLWDGHAGERIAALVAG